MKKITRYLCEICGTEYGDKEKAAACEKTHLRPKEIIGLAYHPHTTDSSGCPITIDVKMTDGNVRRYKRLREAMK